MPDNLPPVIEAALAALPPALCARSGAVFYSGRAAFAAPAPLYLLGLNPGGDPVAQAAETVAADLAAFRGRPAAWSAYVDQGWRRAAPGAHGLQPRLLHLLAALGLDPRRVPASNVVFVRSRSEAALAADKAAWLAACWPVHQAVIDALQPRIVLCLGRTAGRWVRERLDAHALLDRFREANARGWTSTAHRAADGRMVLTLAHPGRADWRNPAADPTPLVQRILSAA